MDHELKTQDLVILDLPEFLEGARDCLLDVSITYWQGVSRHRKHYFMDLSTNGVRMYEHSLGIVYDHKPMHPFRLQKEAFSALHMANECGNRYTLKQDKSGLLIARLNIEGLNLPIDNSNDLFRRIAEQESKIVLPEKGICQLLQESYASC